MKSIYFNYKTLLLAVFLGTAINAQNLAETAVVNDKSLNNPCELDTKKLLTRLIIDFDLKNDRNKGIELRCYVTGEGRVPEENIASLPKAKTSFFGGTPISERKKELAKFLVKAKSDLAILATGPCDRTQTNLYRTIVYLSKKYGNNAT
jgi:hypothetical protein